MLLTLDESEMQTVRDGVEEMLTARRSSSSSSTRGHSDLSTQGADSKAPRVRDGRVPKIFRPKSKIALSA